MTSPRPARIRVTFTADCLPKDEKNLRRWVLIPPEVQTIGDWSTHLAKLCKHDIQLGLKLDDCVLPESESISLLRESDQVDAAVAENFLAIDQNSWREQLKAGDKIDVRDVDDKWCEAVIRSISGTSLDNIKVNIHFLGWGDFFDVALPPDSERIAKLGTHTEDWRSQLKLQSAVEVKKDGRWFWATVRHVRADGELYVQALKADYSVWLSPHSDMLSRPGTHIRKPVVIVPSSSTKVVASEACSLGRHLLLEAPRDHSKRQRCS